MTAVIVHLGEQSVWFDVICAECKAVIVENLPCVRAAYCQAGEISGPMSEHKCEIKVSAA